MRVAFLIVAISAAVLLASVSLAAAPTVQDATPAQTIAKQRRAIVTLREQRADLTAENEDLTAANSRLKARLAAVPDPLDAILARDPDGLWAAVQAIWAAFPTLPAGGACGYDKSSTPNNLLTPASFTFARWQVC